MELQDVLAEASCLISGPRQETYGDIRENWERTGIIWAAILGLEEKIDAATVGVMFAGAKISRMSADISHLDNYVDAIAYIAGAAELATE
jgi:hypothetical protein